MEYLSHRSVAGKASAEISRFAGRDGIEEYNLIVRVHEYDSVSVQLQRLRAAYEEATTALGLAPESTVFRRLFLSDPYNQASEIEAHDFANPGHAKNACAISWIGQAPLMPGKVAMWAYHIRDPRAALHKQSTPGHLALQRGSLTHHWTTGITAAGENSCEQTQGIFQQYDATLKQAGMTLADNVLRTWLFVRDIDANYHGMVVARREFFTSRGLTPKTHFIASSGIEGVSPQPTTSVLMDAYAIAGVQPDQVQYLSARDHLSPTHVYGVTFERGTSIAYRDRKHVLLSGTASIDSAGNILHPGDVARQLDRTLENMQALLAGAGADLSDMSAFIVYVRDPADQMLAQQLMRERFATAPVVVLLAPVCRPGWLIELEGIAIIPATNPSLPSF